MNTHTLVLVDPAIAQMKIDERARHIHRFTGEKTFPTDFEGCSLKCEYRAKETPLCIGPARGQMGVEFDVEITRASLVNACGTRSVVLPDDFFDLRDFAAEIEADLEAEAADHG